jgi:hypothetical protein
LRKYQVEAARVLKAHFLGPRQKLTRSEQLLEIVQAQVRQERLARRARKLALLAERKADESRQLAEQAQDLARTAIDIHSGNHGMYTVLGFARLHGWPMDVKVASRHGKSLSRLCRDQGEPIGSVRDPRFGQVNTYPEKVLNAYFSAHAEDN